MAIYKNDNGTWYVMIRYQDWTGARKQKCKRGFSTRKEAADWELGQNVVSYNVQNELRLVRKGFPLRYSLKEKLQCKSVIGMFLLLLPMLCYWIAYKIELFSIILWIWIPIQSIIIYTAKNRLQRLLYILPFYILSLLSMRVWQMFF